MSVKMSVSSLDLTDEKNNSYVTQNKPHSRLFKPSGIWVGCISDSYIKSTFLCHMCTHHDIKTARVQSSQKHNSVYHDSGTIFATLNLWS